MKENETETIICLACMTPNDAANVSCQNCRAAIHVASSLDPLQTIRNEGSLYRKAVVGPPKLIVVIGTWILFAPWTIIVLIGEYQLFTNWFGFGNIVFIVAGFGLLYFALKMLYSTTNNYLTNRAAFEKLQQEKPLTGEKKWRSRVRKKISQ